MMRNIVILLISILPTLHLIGQNSLEKVELPELEIIDSNLLIVLDSFLLSEQLCEYYHDSLYFNIDICNIGWNIGEECHMSDTIMIVFYASTRKWGLFITEQKGFFIYKNHLYTVQGLLIPELISSTGENKILEYRKRNTNYILKEDDSKSIWGILLY